MHAAVELERRGVVAVAFGTEAFRGLATLQAKAMGMPDLPVVLIPHPLGGIPLEQALAKAHTVVDEVAGCVRERMAAGSAIA